MTACGGDLGFSENPFFPKTVGLSLIILNYIIFYSAVFFVFFPPSTAAVVESLRVEKPPTGQKIWLQQAPETPGESDVVTLFVTLEQRYRENAPLHAKGLCVFFLITLSRKK